MGPFDARAIANAILDVSHKRGTDVTLMQLIKLVYLAHGWWLAFSREPLTSSDPQAWQYGPVHPQVYKAFKKFGSSPITERAIDGSTRLEYREALPEEVRDLLEGVVDSYGDMHAFKLSDIMHQPGTPWSITKDNTGLYSPIPSDLIRRHFDELRQQQA